MSLTRLDCHFYRSPGSSIDTSSFVALNPARKPGSLVVASASAIRESIGSQVACRLSLEHFVDGALEYFESSLDHIAEPPSFSKSSNGTIHHARHSEASLDVLETAFRKANNSVYNFGHKLAAGGRMAASLLGLVIEESSIAAGRVGAGSAFLYRDGQLFPFFDPDPELTSGNYVGANSLVSVELASVSVKGSDIILIFSQPLGVMQQSLLVDMLETMDFASGNPCALLSKRIFEEAELSFAMAARIGPEAIYLHQQLIG